MSRALPDQEPEDFRETKPFLDHLEDLRRTVIAILATLSAAIIICIPLTPVLLGALMRPLGKVVENPDRFLRSLRVAGAFTVTLRMAAWCGLLLSAPLLGYFAWRFVMPGLTRRERTIVRKAFGFAAVLFLLGVCLGYFACLPIALRMMLRIHNWLHIAAEWTVNDYVAFCTQMLIGFGLAFELPVVVFILGKLDIVSLEQLRQRRRHVLVACLVVGMLLTPQDIPSQLIMAVPLYLLFELCVLLLWLDQRT
jgi:sec-independent protein translocase protein TatC